MTPREALYHLCIELGPVPQTTRDDNLSPKEIRLREAVNTLKEVITETESSKEVDYIEKGRKDLMEFYCNEASKH